ncbi:MAG: hypothetical protein K2N32_05425, partial [Clostridia bacterium]|nr:hypothetical protein [Clostridia bacterium]
VEKEVKRLQAEYDVTMSEVQRSERMLSNQGFVAKAPKALIDKEKEKLVNYTEKAKKLKSEIDSLLNN